ncbi:uncharacterized protein LOC144315591 [Canis aureus]
MQFMMRLNKSYHHLQIQMENKEPLICDNMITLAVMLRKDQLSSKMEAEEQAGRALQCCKCSHHLAQTRKVTERKILLLGKPLGQHAVSTQHRALPDLARCPDMCPHLLPPNEQSFG